MGFGLPRWHSGQQSTCQCRRPNRGFHPWVEKIPGVGNGNPLQYSCLERIPGTEEPGGYSTRGHKESDPMEHKRTAPAAKAVLRRELYPPRSSIEGLHPQRAVPLSFQRGQGAPAREPIISSEEQKQLMLYYHRRQEELKVPWDRWVFTPLPHASPRPWGSWGPCVLQDVAGGTF